MEIEEGRLVERPCPDCGGIERRAFGEVESQYGELASYAFGWTSGHADPPTAHMTIGIGAGNPGGGSFHIEWRAEGMRLVDEPFEEVPEGGPHLSREEALAHEDLPFVWFVADSVVTLDRRAWWTEAYLHGTRAFVTPGVAELSAPVLHVVHTDEGEWHLLEGAIDGARLTHLFHALDADQTLLDVLDLEKGARADRRAPGAPWARSKD